MTSAAAPSPAAAAPLAVGPFTWRDAGGVVFLGNAGLGEAGAHVTLDAADDLAEFAAGPRLRGALADFFAAGGRRCRAWHAPGLDSLSSEGAAALLGDDGGPGYRSGLQALADLDDAGIVHAPGAAAPPLRLALAALVSRQRDLFVVVEGGDAPEDLRRALARGARPAGGDEGGGLDVPDGRIAWVAGGGAPSAAARLGILDRLGDLSPARSAGGADLPTLGGAPPSLMAWRRSCGLRRSLDEGTRWVLYEVADPGFAARVERQIKAYLLALHERGILEGRAPEEAFAARCRTALEERPHGAAVVVDIEVQARLRRERGAAAAFEWRGRAPIEASRY